ncbi:hypothetical protein, partial [Mycolicibacter heraklionensis]|uniref:hypothetical protein n=1 Tax=Mycolicibacter heraklionensis TaxID=512402 RepID=UPI001A975D6D
MSAIVDARSSATQHMSLEYKKCRGSPRISQMPWSGSPQRRAGIGAVDEEFATGASAGMFGIELVDQAVCRAEQLTVDVELALPPGAVADPHRPAV